MFKALNRGKEELEGKVIRKFRFELGLNKKIGAYAEYLCADDKFELVSTVERQFIDTEKETISIFIKSCNESVTIDTTLIDKSYTCFFNPLVNKINECENQRVPIIKFSKLEIHYADLKIITRETKYDVHKICNLLSDDRSIAKDYDALMNNKDSSDVTIVIGDKKFFCHKLILSTRSPVFARMLEADMLEKQRGLVAIEDVTPETFELLLKYIYTGSIDKTEMEEMRIDWVELMLAAEKYDIDGLKKVCWKNITGNLRIDNAIDALILADRLNQYELKEFIASYIIQNKTKLVDTEKYEELMKNHHELALLLVRIFMRSKCV